MKNTTASIHRPYVTGIACVLLAFMLGIVAVGCVPAAKDTPPNRLPVGSKVIEDLGHGWLVFEVQGRKFLYAPYGTEGYADGRAAVLAPWNPAP